MKKIITALLLLVFTTGLATAQAPPDHPPGPPNPELRLDHLAILLDLTDEQKAQVKTILDAEHAKMKAQFEAARASGTRPSFEEMRAARQQQKAEVIQQLTSVLNAAQLKKFEVLLEEERGRWEGPRGHGPHGQHGQSSGDTSSPAN
jgi:Spy/CpxP family protein refolding chaperone